MEATSPGQPATTTPEYLTPAEVAQLLRVDAATVIRWAKAEKLPHVRTPGGHYRFARTDIAATITAHTTQEA